MSTIPLVNGASFHHLFMQLVCCALTESKPSPSEPADQEAAFYRIEQLGYQVGQRLLSPILFQYSSTLITEQLERVKFLCKEFWTVIFGKAIDNLKTNHKGVYVLYDYTFDWITRFGADANSPEAAKMAVLVG